MLTLIRLDGAAGNHNATLFFCYFHETQTKLLVSPAVGKSEVRICKADCGTAFPGYILSMELWLRSVELP